MRVSNLDHLGIVAGIIDEMGIVEQINRIIGQKPREKVSSGIIVKAMLLNGLGFVSAPLYMFSKFFEGKATEHLLGTGITAEQINDDRIGDVLDDLHEAGLTETFLGISELQSSKLSGYATAESISEYGGVKQRWILVESQARRKSDIKQLEKKLAQIQQNCHQQLQILAGQDFACIADAVAAAEKLSSQMKWHQLSDIETIEKPHYATRGKPKAGAIPSRMSYRIRATVIPVDSDILAQQVRCGRFILATNLLESAQFTADDALREYKEQQVTERGFRFLKDPLFFTSSVFLKSAKRIEALGLIMALCLLVYNLAQRQLRLALALSQNTIPNQLGKPTNSPTLRWVFQCFMAVHLVSFQGVTQVVNLSPPRLHILNFFSPACQRYYLLPAPVS